MATKKISTNQLKADLENLTQTVEDWVSATADDTRSDIKSLRARAEKRLKETRERGEELYDDARESVSDQADVCGEYVRQNPWTSIGISAAVGVVFGLLLGRR